MLGFLPNDLVTNKPLGETSAPANLTAENMNGLRGLIQNIQVVSLARQILLANDNFYRSAYQRYNEVKFVRKEGRDTGEVGRQYAVTGELLLAIDSLCNANKAPLIVASIPQFYEVLGSTNPGIDVHAIDGYFSTFAARHGFTWITTLKEFQAGYKSGIKSHYRIDGHLTPAGNKILAQTVETKLESKYQK
jgi:hypothetical protein